MRPFMILYREVSWWYWLVSAGLLISFEAGQSEALWLAIGLTLVQVVHFRLREGRFTAFPVQVRMAYALILMLGLWEPLRWIIWVPTIGTVAQVVFGYCALARMLSLLPWNRAEPMTPGLVWRTVVTPPIPGSILHGQPPLRA